MTPETLELYKKLQPLFPKDWKVGDYLYDPFDKWVKLICDSYGYPHCETAMIQKLSEGGGALSNKTCVTDKGILHIPLTIDDRNPERGLWGMVDWKNWRLHTPNYEFDIIASPTDAILKALVAQEEL